MHPTIAPWKVYSFNNSVLLEWLDLDTNVRVIPYWVIFRFWFYQKRERPSSTLFGVRGGMMLARRALVALGICSVALFLCPSLFGQANGSITGAVTDATGAAVASAKVTVTNQATNIARSS